MKKAKTLLGIFIIMLVSIFTSACSCSGGDDSITHVYEQGIKISFVSGSEGVEGTLDENSGNLDIICRVGDRFILEYEITPSNATKTQVNWDFNTESRGLIIPKGNEYTRNNSTKERVEFIVQSRSEANHTSVITFTTATLNKQVKANVTIYEPARQLATLVAPTNVKFDPIENALVWDKVTTVYQPNSTVATQSNVVNSGLTRYEIVSMDPTTGEELVVDSVSPNELKYTNVEAGREYAFKVRAIGNPYIVNSSDYSETYRFYKLNPITEISNNNGTISYTTPVMPDNGKVKFFYFGKDYNYDDQNEQIYEVGGVTGETTNSFDHTIFSGYNKKDKYTIETIVYPSNATVGVENPIHYFPSDVSEPLIIQKLKTVSPKLVERTTNIEISENNFEGVQGSTGIKFNNINGTTALQFNMEGEPYDPIYQHQCFYEIYDDDSRSTPIVSGEKPAGELISLDQIDNVKAGGVYYLKVKSIGNTQNTISSGETTLRFYILHNVSSDGVVLEGDILKANATYYNGGIEIFLINKTNYADSKLITLGGIKVDQVDLSKYSDLKPGTYDVYAKYIHYFGEGNCNAVITPSKFKKIYGEKSINILSNVTSNKINANGDILFTQLTDYKNYVITIGRKKTGEDSYDYCSIPAYIKPTDSEALSNTVLYYDYLKNGFENYEGTYYTAKLNVYDVVQTMINCGIIKNITNAEDYINSQYEYNYKIITSGSGNETNISSIGTTPVKFNVNNVVSNVDLNNYVVSFDKVGTDINQEYVMIVDLEYVNAADSTETISKSYTCVSFKGSVNGDRVSIDLNDLIVSDEDSVADIINKNSVIKEGNDTFRIKNVGVSLYAVGSPGKGTTSGKLNSNIAYVPFAITGTPYDLTVNKDGKLSWTVDAETDGRGFTYNIYFYEVEKTDQEVNYKLLTGETSTGSTYNYTTQTEGTGENVKTTYTYNTNIAGTLLKYKDTVIAVSVVQNCENKFSGIKSEKIHATRISSPELSMATENGKDLIKWLAIENANAYDVSVSKAQEVVTIEESVDPDQEDGSEPSEPSTPTFSDGVVGQTTTSFILTDRIKSESNPWTEGVYKISVSARNSNEDATGQDVNAPVVLTSAPVDITIYIINKSISVSVNDKTLSWSNVCSGTNEKANYFIKYTLADGTESSYTPEGGEETNLIPLENATTYNASNFVAGTNIVTIVPTIDFATTGFIIIGEEKENAVVKLQEAKNYRSENGNFVFDLFGFTDASAVNFELYNVDNGQDKLIPETSYKNNTPATIIDGQGNTCLKFTVVLDGIESGASMNLKVKIKADGILSSDLNEDAYEGTKLSTINDFEKQGNWLVWSAVEGATSYEIKYTLKGSDAPEVLLLRVEKHDTGYYTYTKKVNVDENGEEIGVEEVIDTNIFKYESGKFYHIFNEELFVGENTGDIQFTIRPLTELDNYFNGNTSSITTITKLNANVDISVVDGKVNIANYVADGENNPLMYKVTVYKIETVPAAEENGEPTVQKALDDDGKEIAWTETKGYVVQENGLSISAIDLNTLTYTGKIDGQTKTISFKVEGDYQVEVTFLGNDNNIIDSKTTVPYELDKLAIAKDGLTNAISTIEGEVVWGAVEGAENYTLEVSDGTETLYFEVTGQTLKNVKLTVSAPEENPGEDNGGEEVQPEVTSVANNVFTFDAGKQYTLRLRANAQGKLHSQWSDIFYVQKLIAPTSVSVYASSAVRTVKVEVETEGPDGNPLVVVQEKTIPINSPLVSWIDTNIPLLKQDAEIIYGSAFKTTIPYAGKEIKDAQDRVTGTSSIYAVETNLAVGTYGLQLRVFGSSSGDKNIGYLTSDYSTAVNVKYVDDVVLPTVTEGIVNWTGVSGAYSYKVRVYKTSDYLAHKQDPENTTLNSVVETFTTGTSLDLSTLSFASLNSYTGSYTIVVNALTNPTDSIVTTTTTANGAVTVYKPQVLESYKVKNGMLSWRISISDVRNFVAGQVTVETVEETATTTTKLSIPEDSGIDTSSTDAVLLYVLKYIMNKVNGTAETTNTALETQIAHYLNVNLDINNKYVVDSPTMANIVNVVGSGSEKTESYIYSADNYLAGEYIEYFYNVAIEPEINNQTKTTSNDYVAGKYTVRVAPVGNTDTSVPVIACGYTTALTAYKPNTPVTWTSAGADISLGKVQWELSTTQDSTQSNFVYYEKYRITAISTNGGISRSVDVDITDTELQDGSNPNITENYRYYRYLKDDLFVTQDTGGNLSNVLAYNTDYKLFISTIGTVDSDLLSAGETIYLNSNHCSVNNIANILKTTSNVKIENNKITWDTSNGSTATRLYIYGPFNNLELERTKVNKDWADSYTDIELEKIKAVGMNDTEAIINLGITKDEINEYLGLFRTIDFDGSSGRETEYTLTNKILNGSTFLPGGYIIKLQEIGDDKGRIDSVISDGFEVIKLGHASGANGFSQTTITLDSGWVGLSSTYVYAWDKTDDVWKVKTNTGSIDQVTGTFVWKPVVGANGYKIEAYRVPSAGGQSEYLLTAYTSETTYELGVNIPTVYNHENYLYYINVTAIRVDVEDIHNIDYTQLSDNYFCADDIDSTSHSGVAVPEKLKIYGDGSIKWNEGVLYDTVSSYRVQFNYGEPSNQTDIKATQANSDVVPEFRIGDGSQNGTITISVKSVAKSGNSYINSSYCIPVSVTRLADPDPRLIDGVFYWGTGGDPVTNTELYLDGDLDEKELPYETFIKYFTDITEHNVSYTSDADELDYEVGDHEIKVKFQGTGGASGEIMAGQNKVFYISSNTKTMNVNKLNAPDIENVNINVAETNENMVRWNLDAKAQGYRVRVFSSKDSSVYVEKNIDIETLNTLIDSTTETHNFFYARTEEQIVKVYFKLNQIIQQFNLVSGGTIYVYVQALGSGVTGGIENLNKTQIEELYSNVAVRTGDSDVLYLSSSYSTATSIGIPPQPTGLNYNGSTGEFTWNVESESVFNIKVETSYVVEKVTYEEINNYWNVTSDLIYYSKDGTSSSQTNVVRPYSDIIYRKITITETDEDNIFDIFVEDVIRLLAKDNGNKTPTSYKLTTIGKDYTLSVTAMSFIESTSDDTFVSEVSILAGTCRFELFSKGDGSEKYPYSVSDYRQLDRIRLFTERDYMITENITLPDEGADVVDGRDYSIWIPIANFSGTIDGNNHYIDKYSVGVSQDGIMTFIKNNDGTIKNLTIKVADEGLTFNGGSSGQVNIAGIAITNSGTIENIIIEGDLNAQPTIASYTSVAGIVIENKENGVINNVSVNSKLIALDDSSEMTAVGGIAKTNHGTISRATFNGEIKANAIGGIVLYNYAVIDRCCVTELSTLFVTDKSLSKTTRKTALVGGLVGSVIESSNVSITNSYSLATINITKSGDLNSNSYIVAGLIATIDSYAYATIKNNYVVTKISIGELTGAGSIILCYAMAIDPSATGVTRENNYYLVGDIDQSININQFANDSATQVTDIDELCSTVAELKDEEGDYVYIKKTGDIYPSHI